MILSALTQYYERLNKNSQGAVPSFGFSEEKIGYILVLSEQGELVDLVPNLSDEKKPKPKLMNVPMPSKKSVNISPNFLWGNTQYVLGISEKVIKPPRTVLDYFGSFKRFHLEKLSTSKDPGLIALSSFLQNWSLDNVDDFNFPKGFSDKNIVFQLDGKREYIHESKAAKDIWAELVSSAEGVKGICLVTGMSSSISRLHHPIKSPPGWKKSEVSIVSFNIESAKSYMKEQGANSPVSEFANFAYTKVLTYLLREENEQVISLGDTTVVFWALADSEEKAKSAETFFMKGFNPPSPTDESEAKALASEFEKLAKGRPLTEISPDLDPNTQFFILGVAPNAARLSIRFWLQTDLGHIQQRFTEHFQDLALNPLPWKTLPSLYRLLLELIPTRYESNGNKKKKDINDAPAHLAGELMRAILTGQRYPRAILAQLLSRFRSDGDINGLRVAMVKSVMQREFRLLGKEEISMSLDESNTNPAYLLGRLFAVLENIQRIALGDKVNATITDKYFAAASTVPYSVYPRLLAGSKHHLSRVRKDKPGLAFSIERELGVIMSSLPTEFPRHFSIENQGRFSIGYYHQKNARFAKSESVESNELITEGNE